MGPSSDGDTLQEWKEARSIIDKCEENLDGLRKYGFTVIAGLLVTDTFQKVITSDSLDDIHRFALTVIIMGFVFTLQLFDRHYRVLEKTVSVRAMILERILNFETTQTISERYDRAGLGGTDAVYFAFIVLTGSVGLLYITSFLWQCAVMFAVLLTGAIMAGVRLGLHTNLIVRKHYEPSYTNPGKEDWIIDRVSCDEHGTIRITVMNLSSRSEPKKTLEFPEGKTVCQIKDEEENLYCDLRANKTTTVFPNGNCSWIWHLDDKNPRQADPYKVYRVWPRGWRYPLTRSIFVARKEDKEPEKPGSRAGQRA